MMDGRSIVQAVNHAAIIHCTLPTHTQRYISRLPSLRNRNFNLSFSHNNPPPWADMIPWRQCLTRERLFMAVLLHVHKSKSLLPYNWQLTLPSGAFTLCDGRKKPPAHQYRGGRTRWKWNSADGVLLRFVNIVALRLQNSCRSVLKGLGEHCVWVSICCPKDTSNIFKPCVLDWYGIV